MSEFESPPIEAAKNKSKEQRQPIQQKVFNRRQILAAAAGFVGGGLLTATGIEAYNRGSDSNQASQSTEKEIPREEDRKTELYLGKIKIQNRRPDFPESEPLHFRTSPEVIYPSDKGPGNEISYDKFKKIYGQEVHGDEFFIENGEIIDQGNLPGGNPSGGEYDKYGGKWLKLKVELDNGDKKDVYVSMSSQTRDYMELYPVSEEINSPDNFAAVEIKDNQVYFEGSSNPEPFTPNQVTFPPAETAQQ